ncbi:MAG: hypothetical protein ABEJ79_00980 [Halolamina sp.]
MASAVELVLFLVVLGVHTLLAAVLTRYFRVTLKTTWGRAVYALFIVPVVLLVTTQLFTGLLNIGPQLGGPAVVLAVLIGLPMALGAAVDLLYVPQPEEYELPDTQEG